MPLVRIAAPVGPAVSPSVVREHLRLIEGADDSGYLMLLTAAATEAFDGPEGLLGRALISQRWTLKLPCFPAGPIVLPLPPVQLVEGIRYRDATGATVTLSTCPGGFIIAGVGTDETTVRPVPGTTWPATQDHPEAVEVDFRCGYGDTAEAVPAPIRIAILETIADRYAYRESVSAGAPFSVLSPSARRAAEAYRVRWCFG